MGIINKSTAEINDLLDKVENMPEEGVIGKTPILETGTTTTLDPGQSATSEVVATGTDSSGNPKYKINFGIPKGYDGSSTGGGGVADSVQWTNVLNKPTWVNSSTKPTYTATEVGALPASTTIPSKTSQLTNDSDYVTSSTLKTINGQSIVGTGNIEISGSGSGIADAPSDGQIYGRKNGNWSAITGGTGGSVDISDIFQRILHLAEVNGTCTDGDYNTLKGYADSGTVTYVSYNGISTKIDIKNFNDIIQISYNIEGDTGNSVIIYNISTSKEIIVFQNAYYPFQYYGQGSLGNYTKPSSYSAITKDDSISTAIGKLEAGIGSSSSTSSGIYYLPKSVLDITKSSTNEEVLNAFGGYEKMEEFLTEVAINGKLGLIRRKTTSIISGTSFSIPVSLTFLGFLSSYFVINFIDSKSPSDPSLSRNISIYIKYDSSSHSLSNFKMVEKYINGYWLDSSFYNINTDSTNEEISNALGGESGMISLIEAIEDGNNIFIKSSETNQQRTELLSNIYSKEGDGSMSLILFGFGFNLWGITSGYITIHYDKSSNTFSASEFTLS